MEAQGVQVCEAQGMEECTRFIQGSEGDFPCLCIFMCACAVYITVMCNHVTFISSHVLFPMCSWQVTTPVT